MTNALVLSTVENEARVRDVDLAVSLGMKQPLNIRAFIQRNRDELASFGPIHTQRELVTIGSGATREVLPSIRKTGGYQLGAGETMPLPTSFTDALRQHASGTRAPGERWPPNVSRKGRHGGSSRRPIYRWAL